VLSKLVDGLEMTPIQEVFEAWLLKQGYRRFDRLTEEEKASVAGTVGRAGYAPEVWIKSFKDLPRVSAHLKGADFLYEVPDCFIESGSGAVFERDLVSHLAKVVEVFPIGEDTPECGLASETLPKLDVSAQAWTYDTLDEQWQAPIEAYTGELDSQCEEGLINILIYRIEDPSDPGYEEYLEAGGR
jgi:hypothetical protein